MNEVDNDETLELIHRRYGDPCREWKDFDIHAAVLDIGRLLGIVVQLRGEARDERAKVQACKNHIHWMAQTTHQSYHTDDPRRWNDDCLKDICSSTRHFILHDLRVGLKP